VLAGLVLSSITASVAHAQGSASSAAPPVHDPEDEDATGAAPPAVTAPADPKLRTAWLRDRVTAAIAASGKLGGAKTAVSAIDLATGVELVAHDADRGMSLASAAKLFTSAAALSVLGGGFRWRTSVYGAEPDDKGVITGELYVKGRGDPMLGPAEMAELAKDVAARGVRAVDRLVIDGSYFDDVIEPPHFDDQKTETAGFRAPVASFGVARSAITVTVTADPGGAATVALVPDPGEYFKVVNKGLSSVRQGRTRLMVNLKTKIDHPEIEVAGQIRWGEGSWEVRKRVDDPARFAGEVFRRALAAHGVKVKAHLIGSSVVPATAVLLAAHESAPLSDVIRQMNKLSDNYLAECVLKTLGAQTKATPGPATWADGRAALQRYLAEIGLPAAGYRVDNGSGLFDATEVSARQVTTLLRAAHRDFRVGPDLVASLPIGGVDGTLAKRWRGHAAAGRIRAKTGTLDKVIALAGYVAIDSQRPVGFAILMNDIPPGQRASARTAADEILDALVSYLGAQ
jgi:D-alanyl-D-alanine carboxypeptidase/D-alanyl-D-alanine-endopeptidase (penicillin-binding protein 4)